MPKIASQNSSRYGAAASTMAGTARALQVLLVEDDCAEFELLCEQLAASTSGSFEIAHALNMAAAMRACSVGAFDCIVLGWRSSSQTAIDAVRAMRADNPGTAIVIYASVDDPVLEHARLREEIDDVINRNRPEASSLDRSILLAIERLRALNFRRKLEAVLEAFPDALVIRSADGIVRFANSIAVKRFGGELAAKFDAAPDDPGPDLEIERRHDPRAAQVRVASCTWENEECELVSIRDEIDQKALKERLRKLNKLELIAALGGGLAHDFGNIVATIDVIAELGQKESTSTTSERFVEIRAATEAGRAIVRQLLSLGERRLCSPTNVDLHDLIDETEKRLKQIMPKDVRLDVKCDRTVSPILVDRAHLEQVLLNLALNARDAMADPGVLRIECEDCSPPAHTVRISVSDTGCGIAEADLPRIFDLFFSTKPAGRGSGIGLAICQAMVAQAGGAINVVSQLGKGSTFHIFLPKA